jgi:hypothetical protein
MLPLIEDLLTEADRSGFVARAIRLGRRQMHLYEQWCSQYDLGSAPGRRSGTSQYNELPIETVAQDDYRGEAFAVGTLIAERPPHRSEQALARRRRGNFKRAIPIGGLLLGLKLAITISLGDQRVSQVGVWQQTCYQSRLPAPPVIATHPSPARRRHCAT